MCRKNFACWCGSLFLLIASSSKSHNQQNSLSNKDKNDLLRYDNLIRYELNTDSTANYTDKMETMRCTLYEKFTSNKRDDDNLMQNKFGTYFTQNHENKIHRSLMSAKDKNNFMSHKFFENLSKESIKSNIVSYETCYNVTCIHLCCPFGNHLDDDKCILNEDEFMPQNNKHLFLNVYMNDPLQSKNETIDKLFQLTVYDPCQNYSHTLLSDGYQYDYMIFANGSLYLPYYKVFAKSTSYCLALMENKFKVAICLETDDEINTIIYNYNSLQNKQFLILAIFRIMSILFMILIFLVYAILPELQNLHGFMLCNYSSASSIASTIDILSTLVDVNDIQHHACITVAFFVHFCYLASYFWLFIMSFNMWWTFRSFRALILFQKHTTQRKRKKRNRLIFYAIYGWGLPFILATISVIMDSISEYLPEILQPKFRTGGCWFTDKGTFALYFYSFKSVCVISSIYLSISATLKIARYERDIRQALINSGSKPHGNRFEQYQKLFILAFVIMAIYWVLVTVSLLFEFTAIYLELFVELLQSIKNLFFFVIFVWKKRIKRILMKRLGCGLFPETYFLTSVASSNISRHHTTSKRMFVQKKMYLYKQSNCHAENSPKETKF